MKLLPYFVWWYFVWWFEVCELARIYQERSTLANLPFCCCAACRSPKWMSENQALNEDFLSGSFSTCKMKNLACVDPSSSTWTSRTKELRTMRRIHVMDKLCENMCKLILSDGSKIDVSNWIYQLIHQHFVDATPDGFCSRTTRNRAELIIAVRVVSLTYFLFSYNFWNNFSLKFFFFFPVKIGQV